MNRNVHIVNGYVSKVHNFHISCEFPYFCSHMNISVHNVHNVNSGISSHPLNKRGRYNEHIQSRRNYHVIFYVHVQSSHAVTCESANCENLHNNGGLPVPEPGIDREIDTGSTYYWQIGALSTER